MGGPHRPADLVKPHPRLQLVASHRVMEGYGLPYLALGPIFRWFLRVPLYAVYELRTVGA